MAKEKLQETAEQDKKIPDKKMRVGNEVRETREERQEREDKEKLGKWIPKTQLGKEAKSGKIKDIKEIFESGRKILEPEIADSLVNLKSNLLNIGQSKGKFGGGKRRAWRQTQKKTKEGNIPTFAVMAVVGNENGLVGIGYGRAKETLPAKEKAIRKAKLNIHKIERGCGSYNCSCDELHSIPFSVEGKCSSVKIKLMPAPQGTGLVAGDEVKKILSLAGIKDIYSKTYGKTRTTLNTAKAVLQALDKLSEMRL